MRSPTARRGGGFAKELSSFQKAHFLFIERTSKLDPLSELVNFLYTGTYNIHFLYFIKQK